MVQLVDDGEGGEGGEGGAGNSEEEQGENDSPILRTVCWA